MFISLGLTSPLLAPFAHNKVFTVDNDFGNVDVVSFS